MSFGQEPRAENDKMCPYCLAYWGQHNDAHCVSYIQPQIEAERARIALMDLAQRQPDHSRSLRAANRRPPTPNPA